MRIKCAVVTCQLNFTAHYKLVQSLSERITLACSNHPLVVLYLKNVKITNKTDFELIKSKEQK